VRGHREKSGNRQCGTCGKGLRWTDERCWRCNAVLPNRLGQIKWALLGLFAFSAFCAVIYMISALAM